MKNPMSSAISYVLVSLFLSGQVLANPADVSGNLNQNTDTSVVGNLNMLAMNKHVASEARPFSLQIEKVSVKATAEDSIFPEQFLDGLNSKMQNELEQQINQYTDSLF